MKPIILVAAAVLAVFLLQCKQPTDPDDGVPEDGTLVTSLDAFVITACCGGWNYVYLNDGSATFTRAYSGDGYADYSTDVALGDLDGDGDLDAFVTLGDQYERDRIYLNDGSGSFTGQDASADRGKRSTGVALGDLDGK